MKALWNARKQIIGASAIILLVLLMMNLNSRLGEYFRLSSERDKLSTQVGYDRATKAALDTLVAYATSNPAVEQWARDSAHLARPGDKVIIPITPIGVTQAPLVQPTPTPRQVDNWQVWWALFFGQ
jgi:hypothetical protein